MPTQTALSLSEQAATGFTHLVTITHDDLTAGADAAQTIAILNVNPGDIVDRAAVKLVIPFKDSADSANNTTTLIIGDGNDTDRFFHSNTAGTGIQLNENGTEVRFHINPVAASTAGLNTAPFVYTAADTIDAVFAAPASGKSHAALNTGRVDIFLKVANLNQVEPRNVAV